MLFLFISILHGLFIFFNFLFSFVFMRNMFFLFKFWNLMAISSFSRDFAKPYYSNFIPHFNLMTTIYWLDLVNPSRSSCNSTRKITWKRKASPQTNFFRPLWFVKIKMARFQTYWLWVLMAMLQNKKFSHFLFLTEIFLISLLKISIKSIFRELALTVWPKMMPGMGDRV